ncbi:hypothetical protein C8Q80DRAFT_44546 [Daedaleopsis nitida]|nr:hypothetical protein C8Q80DRAFT_44546 [Daedaleopsis nitida]
MAIQTSFKNPNDFEKVKGRGNKFYCKICTPPGRARGQAMTLAAALRHETENSKHQQLVAQLYVDEWTCHVEPDWSSTQLPEGKTAWEQSWPMDRAKDFIPYWLENMLREERGEEPESMDAFIDRFNEKYREWAESVNNGEVTWGDAQGQVEELPDGYDEDVEEWDGVKGNWYSGGSFDPYEDGLNPDGPLPLPTPRSPESLNEEFRNLNRKWIGVEDEDPFEAWGVSRDDVTPWSGAPVQVQGSDATTPSPRAHHEPLTEAISGLVNLWADQPWGGAPQQGKGSKATHGRRRPAARKNKKKTW